MHWDVLEVRAESGHRLFVRFADGTAAKSNWIFQNSAGYCRLCEIPRFSRACFRSGSGRMARGHRSRAGTMYQRVVKQGSRRSVVVSAMI